MAERRSRNDNVSEYLSQNPELARWVETFRGYCETNKQWLARREFILRNMESFPTVKPGVPSSSLDQLLSLSMVWANNVFLGCRYPPVVMAKIQEMSEGIVVEALPTKITMGAVMAKGKRGGTNERARGGADDAEGRAAGRTSTTTSRAVVTLKSGPTAQAPAQQQPFFNRLYKAVAWKLVSAGGLGPNLNHFEVLQSCVESCKETLTCAYVPLRDIAGLPASHTQRDGHVCEIRCRTVYLGTGYGRDESAARAMASKEALKAFQGRKVTVRICRRRYQGRDVDDLVLLDEQPRTQVFAPALSYPFQEQLLDTS